MNIKQLNPDESPQAAFGALFRSLRLEGGWRQEDLSGPMGYSGSHISAVETGRKWATLQFARAGDTVMGTGDRLEGKWRELKHGVLLEGFPQYAMNEGKAIEVRLYDVVIIPGLLQTADYARVLAESAVQRGAITQQQAEERLAFLAKRQKAVFERTRPPMMFAVLDESCIRRPIGGPEVMAAQLDHLVEFANNPRTMLQIAPFEMGERRALNLPVNLITMADRTMIYYAESHAQGNFDRESPAVTAALTAYHQLQAEALSQAESVAMIKQVRKGTL